MHTFVIVLITIIWGSTFFIIKDTVSDVNEYFIVFARTLIATIAMFIIVLIRNKKSLPDKKAITQGAVLGVLLATTYTAQTIGLKFTSSGHSAFITSSGVILVPLILLIFYKQKLNRISKISFTIVFLGLFLLSYDFQTRINIGDLITMITAVGYAFHIILSARFVKKTNVLALVFYQFLSATIISLIGLLLSNDYSLTLSSKSISSILYLGFIGTLFCYFASVWVLKYVSALKVSIIFSLEPVFAAIIAYLAVHEILNFREISGALLILIGILFYQLMPKYKDTIF